MNNEDTGMAWHYTTLEKWEKIVECGELRPSLRETKKDFLRMVGFRPLLWFTTNQFFEPSVAPASIMVAGDDGVPIQNPHVDPDILLAGLKHAGGGWVRFEYPADRLLTPDQAYIFTPTAGPAAMNLMPLVIQLREEISKINGLWRVSLKPIPLRDVVAIDSMGSSLKWEREWTNEEPRQRQRPLDPFPTFAWM